MIDESSVLRALQSVDGIRLSGRVTRLVGLTMESEGPPVKVGELVEIGDGTERCLAEVVGFKEGRALLMPLEHTSNVGPGSRVTAKGRRLQVRVGRALLGRVLDGLGRPIDGRGPLACQELYEVHKPAPPPLERKRITEPFELGIRAVDALLTCGRGQRMGIFSGSGVGKSTLLGMIARNAQASVNVVALVGERGREVKEFIEEHLREGLSRSVVIVATSDAPALMRLTAAFAAMAIAEYFRDQGEDVLLLMDSLTRFAMAQREVGLAAGEPPTARGYTPSVFALLPRLLERAGPSAQGTITAFFTVLMDADDENDPIADAARGVLDGHILLSRSLARKGHYPAIDVLGSVSRLMSEVVVEEHLRLAAEAKQVLALYQEAEDLVNIGAYKRGANEEIDRAIELYEPIMRLLRQEETEQTPLEEAVHLLRSVLRGEG